MANSLPLADQAGIARLSAAARVGDYADKLDRAAAEAGVDVSALTGNLRALISPDPEGAPGVMGPTGVPDLLATIDQAESALTAALVKRADHPDEQVILARDEVRTALSAVPSEAKAVEKVYQLLDEHGADSAVSQVLTSSWLRELGASQNQPGLADVALGVVARSRAGEPAAAAMAVFGDARSYAMAAASLAADRIADNARQRAAADRAQPTQAELAAEDARRARAGTG